MDNQNNKWNKELLYSAIFFIAGWVTYLLVPLYQMEELIYSSLGVVNVQYFLLIRGLLPAFGMLTSIMLPIPFLFFLCSLYTGIKSLKIASTDGRREMNIPNILALGLVSISSFLITMIVVGFFTLFVFSS